MKEVKIRHGEEIYSFSYDFPLELINLLLEGSSRKLKWIPGR